MQERTLRHLLLSVASSIQLSLNDENTKNRIESIRPTIHIDKKNREPYTITWTEEEQVKSIQIDQSRFRFHVRGDIERSSKHVQEKVDTRTSNWEAAIATWEEMMGTSFPSTKKLAPAFETSNPIESKYADFIQILICSVAIVASVVYKLNYVPAFLLALCIPLSQKSFKLVLFGLVALVPLSINYSISPLTTAVYIYLATYFLSSRSKQPVKNRILLLGLFAVLILCHTNLFVLFPILCLESLVFFIRKQKICSLLSAFFGVICFMSIYVTGSNYQNLSIHHFSIFCLACTLIILELPRSSESNVVRLLGPMTMFLISIMSNVNVIEIQLVLAGWLILTVYNLVSRGKPELNTQTTENLGVSVAIRRK